jgi:hypothetical protein
VGLVGGFGWVRVRERAAIFWVRVFWLDCPGVVNLRTSCRKISAVTYY